MISVRAAPNGLNKKCDECRADGVIDSFTASTDDAVVSAVACGSRFMLACVAVGKVARSGCCDFSTARVQECGVAVSGKAWLSYSPLILLCHSRTACV